MRNSNTASFTDIAFAFGVSGDQPLTADSNGNTTYYLYGMGAIGEKTTAWAYSLPDGVNTPRQLADPTGDITLSSRYTPCPLRYTSVGGRQPAHYALCDLNCELFGGTVPQRTSAYSAIHSV